MSARAMLALAVVVASGCVTGTARAPHRVPPDDPRLPFSNAVHAGGTLYVAGHLGLDPGTGRPPEDPAAEARLLLDAFAETLERAGFRMDDLVDVTVYCSDLSLYDVFNSVYRRRFDSVDESRSGSGFPARAFVGSGPLLRGCRFEMKGIAVR